MQKNLTESIRNQFLKKAQKASEDGKIYEAVKVWLHLAEFLTLERDWAGAYLAVQEAHRLSPYDGETNLALAYYAMKLGKFEEEVMDYLEDALHAPLFFKRHRVFYLMAQYHLVHQEYSEALEAISAGLKLKPQDVDLLALKFRIQGEIN